MCNEYIKNCYSEKEQCVNMKDVRRQISEDRRWEEVLCNVNWINVRFIIERKKTVICSIYCPASSHLVYSLTM